MKRHWLDKIRKSGGEGLVPLASLFPIGIKMKKRVMSRAEVKPEVGEYAHQISRKENESRYEGLNEIGRVYNAMHIERTRNKLSEYYGGVDTRRKREVADGGMIREDNNAMANLPRQAIHCEYPDRFAFQQDPHIDDTVL